MRRRYARWIIDNVKNTGYGQCFEITRLMKKAFPELKRVRGHYYCWCWDKREHWWLKDGNVIIDPTSEQFPSKGQGVYTEWDNSKLEPTGKCMNCGDYCYSGKHVCSEQCGIETDRYYCEV
jgi:hypothetical protein